MNDFEELLKLEAEHRKRILEDEIRRSQQKTRQETLSAMITVFTAQTHNLIMAGIFGRGK